MPDWKQEIRARMHRLNVAPEAKEEIIAELASHFEDGENESPDRESRFSEVKWRKLAAAIERGKREEKLMNNRIKSLWLPALANLALATSFMILFEKIGLRPHVIQVSHTPFAIDYPWLLVLPLSGAAGAFLAKRAHGSFFARLIAGLAPSLVWLAVFSIFGLALLYDPRGLGRFPLDYVALGVVVWVVLPAIGLFVGTLPFLERPLRAEN